jgi:hypothetical protein
MKETFTPGPWDAGWGIGLSGPTTPGISAPFCGGDDWPYEPVRKGEETIAVCPKQDVHAGSHTANARLISAAPDLLEALQNIVKSLAEQDDEGLIEHAEPMQKARAAIRKATGESE